MRYELIPHAISHDAVEALDALLAQAREGQITGIACAAMVRGRRYITVTAGACDHQPTFALGMIAVLADELRHIIHQRDPSDTR